MSVTARDLLQRFAKCLATGDVVGAGDLWAADATYVEAPHYRFSGGDTIQRFLADFLARHTQARLTFTRLIASSDGQSAAAAWEWSYVRRDDGTAKRFRGMCFVTARNGLLTEWSGYSAEV